MFSENMEANRYSAPRQRTRRVVSGWLRSLWPRRARAAGTGSPSAGRPAHAGSAAPAALVAEATAGVVDFLVHVDLHLRFLYVSDASLRFTGYHREFLLGATLHDLVAPADAARVDALFARATKTNALEKDTIELLKSLTYPLSVELRVQRAPYGGREGFAVAGHDVSAWQDGAAQLTHALHHDALTGLPNQLALVAALTRAQADADERRAPFALLLLDLDNYQRVNRALGYAAGDELLRETAQRLAPLAPRGGLIARTGSDEFAILITSPEPADAGDIHADAQALARRLLVAIQQPYHYDHQPVHLSASIGIAFYPDSRHPRNEPRGHDSVSPVLRWADQAQQQAKRSGGSRLMLHVPDDGALDARRLKLESDLYDGVRNGEFSLHFQPITSSATGGVVGVEALMRWQHPEHGLVPPSTFIPLAESIGLINYLGNWVLKAACMQLMQWDARGIALEYVAVNVSPQQFRNPRFKDSVQEALAMSGADPHRLVFEITESLLMQDPAHATLLLEELTALGIRFAVDDFGTGYSSLAYLQRFPLSKLKIDRSFVVNLITSHNDQAIVSAVVGLARTLGLELVAEGVETLAQRDLLQKLGCDQIQGWLVCKALPSDELAQRFESHALRLHEAR